MRCGIRGREVRRGEAGMRPCPRCSVLSASTFSPSFITCEAAALLKTPAPSEAVGSDLLVGSRAENRPRLKAICRKVSQATAAFAGEVLGERCILNGDAAGLG